MIAQCPNVLLLGLLLLLSTLDVLTALEPAASSSFPLYSLQDCVRMALDRNADVLRAREEISRSTGLIVEARSTALPKISTSGNLGWADPSRTEGPFNEPYSWIVSLRVRQPIYAGGQIISGIRAAKLNEQGSLFALQSTLDQVILDVRTSFNTVLLNHALIIVAQENLALLTQELSDQQRRFEAGSVTRYNVLRADVEMANAKPALIRAKNNLRIATAQLAKLIGLNHLSNASGDVPPLDVKGELPPGNYERKFDEVLTIGLAQRSDVKALEARFKSSHEQTKVARSGYFPSLDVFAGYDVISSQLKSFANSTNGAITGIEGSWNIFDGMQTKGRVQQANAVERTAEINVEEARRQVELDIRQAYSRLIEAQELTESQKKNVESAEESLRLARARFEAGAGTQLETLDSNLALTQARTNELQARADYNNALAQLERAMGIMTSYQSAEGTTR